MPMKTFSYTYFCVLFFVLTAFSTYYVYYFYTFEQGLYVGSGASIIVLKSASLVFLLGAFISNKVKLNYFDYLFLFLCSCLSLSYYSAGIAFGINDRLFNNFLAFCFLYIFLISKGSKEKILLSYDALSALVFAQILLDAILRASGYSLWQGGLFVGGLGNPSSFGLACNFCLAYILIGPNSFQGIAKVAFSVAYVIATIKSAALFPILLTFLIIAVFVMRTRGALKPIYILIFIVSSIGLLAAISKFDQGVLGNKLNSLLYFFELTDREAHSISIDQRLENAEFLADYLNTGGTELVFGHVNNTNYFPVDSQYISVILSFGLPVFILFMFFNITALIRCIAGKSLSSLERL